MVLVMSKIEWYTVNALKWHGFYSFRRVPKVLLKEAQLLWGREQLRQQQVRRRRKRSKRDVLSVVSENKYIIEY